MPYEGPQHPDYPGICAYEIAEIRNGARVVLEGVFSRPGIGWFVNGIPYVS